MEFKMDTKGLSNLKKKLDYKHIQKASITALNKTGKKARTAQSVRIRKLYTITAKRLNKGLEQVKGNNLATSSNHRVIIRAKKTSTGNPGLQNYSAKEVLKGISYQIRKDKKRKTKLHAFKPKSSKLQGVFLRVGDKRIMTKGNSKGKRRQPIIRQVGPNEAQMMKKAGITAVELSAKNNFKRLFIHELKRQIKRKR